MIHAHLTSIVLAFVLFINIVIMQNKGTKIKIWHMGLRVSYILILATGVMLFFSVYNMSLLYIAKAVVGIFMIALFEIVVLRKEKGLSTDILWISFSVVFVAIFLIGFILPIGIRLI